MTGLKVRQRLLFSTLYLRMFIPLVTKPNSAKPLKFQMILNKPEFA